MMRRLLTAGLLALLLIACSEQDDEPVTIEPGIEIGTDEATVESTDILTPTSYIDTLPNALMLPAPYRVPVAPEQLAALVPDGALARFGIGSFTSATASHDGTKIAVGSTAGIFVFDTTSLSLLWAAQVYAPVHELVWSPDDSLIGAAQSMYAFTVFDAVAGMERFGFYDYVASSYEFEVSLSFSPDGSMVLTSGCLYYDLYKDGGYCSDGDTHFWDAETGELLYTLDEPAGIFQWSSDSRYLVNSTIPEAVWDMSTIPPQKLPFDNDLTGEYYGAFVFSPDFTTLAYATSSVHVVTWPNMESLYTIPLESPAHKNVLVWSPDGRYLITHRPSDYTDPQVLDTVTGETFSLVLADMATRLWGYYSPELFAWSPDGRYIAMPVNDETVTSSNSANNFTSPIQTPGIGIWDIQTGERVRTFLSNDLDWVRNVVWANDNTLITLRTEPSRLMRINLDAPLDNFAVIEASNPLRVVEWSPDGRMVLGGGPQSLEVWDVGSGKLSTKCIDREAEEYAAVEWVSTNPPLLEIINWNSDFTGTFDLAACAILQTSPLSDQGIALLYSPNRQWVAHIREGTLSVRRAADGEFVLSDIPIAWTHHFAARAEYWPAWSPDSNLLVVPGSDACLRVIRAQTGDILYEYNANYDTGSPDGAWVAWSSDGEHVAYVEETLAIDEGLFWRAYLSIHNATTHQVESLVEIGTAPSWRGAISDITWSPDGRYVVTAHGGNTEVGALGMHAVINFWDVSTGELVRTLRGHANDIIDLDWSPNGSTLASASADGTIILWEIQP